MPSLVSVSWLYEHLENPNLVILDATINKKITKESTRIPSTRFFDIKNKFSDTAATFPSTLPSEGQFQNEARKLGINSNNFIVVYDDRGIYSSARAWWLFRVFGFENVAVLDGGLPEWLKQGLPTSNYSEESFAFGDFEANFKLKLITDFEGVQALSKDKDAIILDARSSDRFQCLIPEPREGLRRGCIPKSKNLSYTELFSNNTLKSKDELWPLFDSIVGKNSKLIFSCGSGITACILALGAHLCDFKNLSVYDGSWTEYGSLTVS